MHDVWLLLMRFGISLSLTLLIELTLAYLFRLRGKQLLLILLVNIVTNPAVVYLDMVFRSLFHFSYFVWQIPLELAVIIIEGVCFARLLDDIPRPYLFAIFANVISYGCGILISLV